MRRPVIFCQFLAILGRESGWAAPVTLPRSGLIRLPCDAGACQWPRDRRSAGPHRTLRDDSSAAAGCRSFRPNPSSASVMVPDIQTRLTVDTTGWGCSAPSPDAKTKGLNPKEVIVLLSKLPVGFPRSGEYSNLNVPVRSESGKRQKNAFLRGMRPAVTLTRTALL
jgi:hypothetical protein